MAATETPPYLDISPKGRAIQMKIEKLLGRILGDLDAAAYFLEDLSLDGQVGSLDAAAESVEDVRDIVKSLRKKMKG
jgi:hypothetical protein